MSTYRKYPGYSVEQKEKIEKQNQEKEQKIEKAFEEREQKKQKCFDELRKKGETNKTPADYCR